MTQTQHHTTPQHNGTIPPNHIGPLVPQYPLPTLHTDTLPLPPPLPILPANRATSNIDDSIGSDHSTMDVGPHDDISTFLLRMRRAANDAASSSHDVTVGSSQPPPPTNTGMDVGAVATSPVTVARKRKARGSCSHVAQDERKRQHRAALLLITQGNTEAGT